MGSVDRLVQTAWRLVLFLLVLAIALPMAARLAGSALISLLQVLGLAFGHSLSGLVWSFLLVAFFIGLCVRLFEGIRGLDQASARSKDSDARRAKLAVRRRAEDVPLGINPPELAEDPDPPISGSSD